MQAVIWKFRLHFALVHSQSAILKAAADPPADGLRPSREAAIFCQLLPFFAVSSKKTFFNLH
jgi:hypothetical protein